MNSKPLLSLKHVNAWYGSIQALYDVSLDVYPGEIVSLIGANGAGKSTLLMTIFGLTKHDGLVQFNHQDIGAVPAHQIASLGLAQVPEGRRIFYDMSVEENLMMGTVAIGQAHMKQDIEMMYELFPRLKERQSQRAGTMSGGEQQMLAIARALMARPKMILLDEPSLGLAPIIISNVFEIIRRIAQQGTTIFLVEQNANQALQLSHRAYVLVNGRITQTGSSAELLADPSIQAAYLGSD